jgi:hypothetical protein
MKKYWIVSALLIIIALPLVNCAVINGRNENWQNNVSKLEADIFMFSKLATRVALVEAKMSIKDAKLIKKYLAALKDLLTVPGKPNFVGARNLVNVKLTKKYQIYGLTIIDVIERYLQTIDLNITEDQISTINIISSGIDGAFEAVQELAN